MMEITITLKKLISNKYEVRLWYGEENGFCKWSTSSWEYLFKFMALRKYNKLVQKLSNKPKVEDREILIESKTII